MAVTSRNGPVLVWSYVYSGADSVQDFLAAQMSLACTSGTGIIPLAAAAAETWRQLEGQVGRGISGLALSAVRGFITAQITAILAGAGKNRWCELVTAPPSAADTFREVFPDTTFVCVHRACMDVIKVAVQSNPWGLYGQGFVPYLMSYPGNSVAALAAYWVSSTEQLLEFEASSTGAIYRVRYEDVMADPSQALAEVRSSLQLSDPVPDSESAMLFQPTVSQQPGLPAEPVVPVRTIPARLRERIARLHGELGYPPPDD